MMTFPSTITYIVCVLDLSIYFYRKFLCSNHIFRFGSVENIQAVKNPWKILISVISRKWSPKIKWFSQNGVSSILWIFLEYKNSSKFYRFSVDTTKFHIYTWNSEHFSVKSKWKMGLFPQYKSVENIDKISIFTKLSSWEVIFMKWPLLLQILFYSNIHSIFAFGGFIFLGELSAWSCRFPYLISVSNWE